jgi:hypothetical protein
MGRRHAPKKTDVQTISGHACATSAQQKGTIIRPRLRDAMALASPTGRHRQAGFFAQRLPEPGLSADESGGPGGRAHGGNFNCAE